MNTAWQIFLVVYAIIGIIISVGTITSTDRPIGYVDGFFHCMAYSLVVFILTIIWPFYLGIGLNKLGLGKIFN